MSDRASQVPAQGFPLGMPKSYRALADHGDVPRTTLQHRARGRRSLQDKARSQQYLSVSEEKALVDFCAQQDAVGRPVRIKYLPSIAFSLACQRALAERPQKPPGKNWAQLFQKRHTGALQTRKSGALDWNRFDIYDKATGWFETIGQVLQDPAVLQENVYNMDETGVMLSKLNSVKVLVCAGDQRGCRGARVKRTTITAVECISASGEALNPMIIWPASNHRANWTTQVTPGWHYAYSASGYSDSYLSLQWLQLVFDPQTKERANGKPRILVCDGFGTHETLEILEFCFTNNIILCRIPSHTSHKLQPCDVSVFGPLNAAYRDQVERLERGCVGTISKEHFTYLYSPARKTALTSRNIRAGWNAAGLFPFNPERVLNDIPRLPSEPAGITDELQPLGASDQAISQQTLVTPVPVSADAVALLQNLINRDAHTLDEASKHRLQRHVQKLSNATTLFLAKQNLLRDLNRFLAEMSNEAKLRRSTKSSIIGTARVMSYEDLEKARLGRAAKDAEKEAKRTIRKDRRTVMTTTEADGMLAGKENRPRKRNKTAATVPAPELSAEAAQTSVSDPARCGQGAFILDSEAVTALWCEGQAEASIARQEPWQAPVARM